MGLLRLRGGRHAQRTVESKNLAGRFAPLPPDGFMRVVGESYYQVALKQVASICVPGPEGRPSFHVALVPELDNPYDPHAVAVLSAAGQIGYLPRDDARRYGPALRALSRAGYDGASCLALLNGGIRGKPSFGVTLCVSYPEDCEEKLGLRADDGLPTVGRVRGRHHSEYVEEVKRLRRAGCEDGAERLLLELVNASEEQAQSRGDGVAGWYYEQLAIIYRRRGDWAAELTILERYEQAPHAPGRYVQKLTERLAKARVMSQ